MAQTDEQRVRATEDAYLAAEASRDEPSLRRLVDDRFVFGERTGATSGTEASATTLRYACTDVKRHGVGHMLAPSR